LLAGLLCELIGTVEVSEMGDFDYGLGSVMVAFGFEWQR
jgi:hypothetical protein